MAAKNTMLKYLWVENFDEIALSRMVKEIEGNSKWPPFLGRGKFMENCNDCIP